MWYTITKVICGLSVFVGAFLAFFGHRWFQLTQFILGSYGVGLCTYIVIAVLNQGQLTNYSQQAGLALAIGNVQFLVKLTFILYARWRFKIVCIQTKLASLAIHKKSNFQFRPQFSANVARFVRKNLTSIDF